MARLVLEVVVVAAKAVAVAASMAAKGSRPRVQRPMMQDRSAASCAMRDALSVSVSLSLSLLLLLRRSKTRDSNQRPRRNKIGCYQLSYQATML